MSRSLNTLGSYKKLLKLRWCEKKFLYKGFSLFEKNFHFKIWLAELWNLLLQFHKVRLAEPIINP